MDSGNSSSLQSSSGGRGGCESGRGGCGSGRGGLEEEYDSNAILPFLDHQVSSSLPQNNLNYFNTFIPVPVTRPDPTHQPATSSLPNQTLKPVKKTKKRSRTSRKAPTTVLTTDTSNFRSMVQEFTGIPAPPPFNHRNAGYNNLLLRPFANNVLENLNLQSLLQAQVLNSRNDQFGLGVLQNQSIAPVTVNGNVTAGENDGTVESWLCSSSSDQRT